MINTMNSSITKENIDQLIKNINLCWNCGKHGHHANYNQDPNKKKDTINRLGLEDNIINKLHSILKKTYITSKEIIVEITNVI